MVVSDDAEHLFSVIEDTPGSDYLTVGLKSNAKGKKIIEWNRRWSESAETEARVEGSVGIEPLDGRITKSSGDDLAIRLNRDCLYSSARSNIHHDGASVSESRIKHSV